MSTQKGASSPKEKSESNTIIKPILGGLAFLAIAAILAAIFISPYFVILAVASVIGGLALDTAQPSSFRLSSNFLKKLSAQSDDKREKQIDTLNNALGIQWQQNPVLFKKNFELLKQYPEIIKALGSSITTQQGIPLKGNNLLTVLINSPNEIASPAQKREAIAIILEMIRPIINNIELPENKTKEQQQEYVADEQSRIVLKLIRNAIMANNEDLAQALVKEWPNTDLNDKDYQRGWSLLSRLIDEDVPYENIRLLLDLKDKNNNPIVKPDHLVSDDTLSPLQIALRKSSPRTDVAMLLKQYGAQNFGTLAPEKQQDFLDLYKKSSPISEQVKATTEHASSQSKPTASDSPEQQTQTPTKKHTP